MRSRRRADPVPDELLDYDPDVWTAEGGYDAWRAARMAYLAVHGPDTALGDILTLLRKHLEVKCRMADIPTPAELYGRGEPHGRR